MSWFDFTEKKTFKFKSLQTYAWDRTMNNLRRYRTVFDTKELNYLSVALEFYNIRFNEKDWSAKVTFKAFKLNKNEIESEICSHDKEITVSKNDNIVVCDYGWGNDEYGSYWKKGDYLWEVYINDEFIESTKFHIFNFGKVTTNYNPYFKVESIKTYENNGNDDDLPENRIYLKTFAQKETHYVMVELEIENLIFEKWLLELAFNYYDDTGILVGTSKEIGYIDSTKKRPYFKIFGTWGSSEKGVWLKDNYRVEVVFMDTVVAIIPFVIGDVIEERDSQYGIHMNGEVSRIYDTEIELLPPTEKLEDIDVPWANDPNVHLAKPLDESEIKEVNSTSNKSLEEVLGELNTLIGLENIKSKINEYIDYVKFLQLRKENGIEDADEINLHSVFTGNPGTGKTTVVKLLGEIYRELGLLSKGHVLTVESNDLVSGYVRQTGETTKEFIKKARGGILFIDEAYMLYKKDVSNDFGPEAIAALITEMSDGPGDIAIMVAGYPKEMDAMIKSNPGLKSRFRNYYHFNDYTPNELVAIGLLNAHKKNVCLSESAVEVLEEIVTTAYRKRDKTFGNARLVNSIIDEAKINLGIRIIRDYQTQDITNTLLNTIEKQDVENVIKTNTSSNLSLKIDHNLLQEALLELNSLIGLVQIKKDVEELVRLSKYYKEIDRDLLKAFSIHSVFSGNPGTGKTTIARILGKIYKALGILERGHIIEADGSSLIAGFVGQTALKTKELIKKAMGGVLFIDEAYAITEGTQNGGSDNFGKKAIAALIKEMENHRGEFAVIVAGYTDNMKRFIEINPGMKSRFDKTFHFEDFSENELWEILEGMLTNNNLIANEEAKNKLKKHISELYTTRNKFFGNARSMRKIAEKIQRNQELRMANLPKNERTKKAIQTVLLEDVEKLTNLNLKEKERVTIGFK